MSILWARHGDIPRDVPIEDDVSGFLDSELRAFDEVGEIGFEKRQGGAVGGALPGPAWVPALVSVPLLIWFSASLGGLVPGGGARIPGLARVGAALARREGAGWRYLFGAATGLLPCGLLYAALALALSAGSAAVGALAMLAFGLGTVPALALLSATVRRLALTGAWPRRALALLVLLAGLGSVGMRLAKRPGAHGHMPLPGMHMPAR